MKFCITHGKGFSITFDNNLTLSTQFGPGNYCENSRMNFMDGPLQSRQPAFWNSKDAEIAVVIQGSGDWFTKEILAAAGYEDHQDDVFGHVNTETWLKIANATANYRKEDQT